MSLGIGRHHQVGCSQARHDGLTGERRVVVVVDQQMVEQRVTLGRATEAARSTKPAKSITCRSSVTP